MSTRWVRWRTRRSRVRCSANAACCSTDLIGTKRTLAGVGVLLRLGVQPTDPLRCMEGHVVSSQTPIQSATGNWEAVKDGRWVTIPKHKIVDGDVPAELAAELTFALAGVVARLRTRRSFLFHPAERGLRPGPVSLTVSARTGSGRRNRRCRSPIR